jgi:hypothetical protein
VFLADAEYLMGMTDGFGVPQYRQITTGASLETRDPAAFLGQPLAA